MKSKTIGQYRITDRKIGEGAFGTVFIGIDLSDNNKEVAVKVVEHSRLEGDALDYFYEEILAMKSCLSEHIVKLYDIKKTENHFYVFLEYCEDGDLQKYIKKKGRIPQEDALKLFWEIVKGFRAIVKSKRIHRDLKPANIFLKNGHIKIGDFGLAKILSERDMTSTFAGSPYNMAPQVLARKHYDNRADIYGIGTVLYEMIFGCPPFKASTVPQLIEEINFKRYKKFDKDLITDETYNLLIRMLRPDPASRISWQQLFAIESKIRDTGSIKMYKKYEELAKKADVKNINAIPGVFCLLNLSHGKERNNSMSEGELEKHPPYAELEFMDIDMCTKLFLSLVQVTEISESCVDF